jgi:hypothetical protein
LLAAAAVVVAVLAQEARQRVFVEAAVAAAAVLVLMAATVVQAALRLVAGQRLHRAAQAHLRQVAAAVHHRKLTKRAAPAEDAARLDLIAQALAALRAITSSAIRL